MGSDRELGEQGLAEALDRAQSRLTDPTSGDPVISVGEVLFWLKALEDHHCPTPGRLLEEGARAVALAKQKAYYVGREATAGGRTLAGLMWARNRFQHELIPTAYLEIQLPRMIRSGFGGRRGGGTMITSALLQDYRWKLLSDLPPESSARETRHLDYGDLVAGQRLIPPLEAAATYLRSLS